MVFVFCLQMGMMVQGHRWVIYIYYIYIPSCYLDVFGIDFTAFGLGYHQTYQDL